jgi:hypothetical protein
MKNSNLEVNGNNGPCINFETTQLPLEPIEDSVDKLLAELKTIKFKSVKKDSIVINATPHDIQEVTTGKIYKTSGIEIRLKEDFTEIGTIDHKVPLFNRVLGEVSGLPQYHYGTYYIVSIMVKNAIPEREDLITVGELVRDENGKIIGCKGFIR